MLAHVVEQVLQRWLLTCQHAASYKRDAPVNWWKSDSIYNVYFNQQFLQFYSHGHEHEHERKNFKLYSISSTKATSWGCYLSANARGLCYYSKS